MLGPGIGAWPLRSLGYPLTPPAVSLRSVAWYLKVNTPPNEHVLSFGDDKAAADAALDETLKIMTTADGSPVKVAGQLVLEDKSITSALVYEAV
jgi:hypothetical protein